MVAASAALLRPDMFRKLALLSVPYLPRQTLRPAVRFQLLTQEQHFYQQYFQEPGRIERELEADVRRALLGILYSASGQARSSENTAIPASSVSTRPVVLSTVSCSPTSNPRG